MTTYRRFEDTPVWQKSADLAAQMFEWTTHSAFRGKGDLANQLHRATLSISNNLAEGFERGTKKELLQFLYVARGSAGEARSMLCVMERMEDFVDRREEISELRSKFESVSRQLRGWANSLQNSDIEGPRHLNDETREKYERRQRRQAFEKELKQRQQQAEEKRRQQAEERESIGE